jgi:hypothetical protein
MRYKFGSLCILLPDWTPADCVLHADPAPDAAPSLHFNRWSRQAGAVFSPLRFKVLLAIENVPAHVWSCEVVQTIIGSSCLIFNTSPRTASGADMSVFLAAAWAIHPDLIPA